MCARKRFCDYSGGSASQAEELGIISACDLMCVMTETRAAYEFRASMDILKHTVQGRSLGRK